MNPLPLSGAAPATSTSGNSPGRLQSIDAYRGFVMFLMMGEALSFGRISDAFPTSHFWAFLEFHQSHVDWIGCSLHDLIQPSFSFLVGVALPFSLANRRGGGQVEIRMVLHAFWRAFILIALGIFLRSVGRDRTNFTFEDTLTQIGLGYGFLFMLARRNLRTQWSALAVILAGYWLAFVLFPTPGADFEWSRAGVKPHWPHNELGLAAHWNKNTNLAWAFDVWFLNLFPRANRFLFNGGGYATLSFIPTLGTMILGLIGGRWLLDSSLSAHGKMRRFLFVGLLGLFFGASLSAFGICPNVKRIWTPSWVLFSGGWCFVLLASFYAAVEIHGWKRWFFPLVVIGTNSIAAYCMDHLFAGFIRGTFRTHLGADFFRTLGGSFAPFLEGLCLLFVLWCILLWLHRRKILIRI